jgi:predicted dehydrogenase
MSDETLDRRDFLKGAATTLAALLSERGLSAARIQDAADTFKGTPVACGVIGVGAWGRDLLTSMERVPSVTIAAVCDPYAPSLKRAAEVAPGAKALPDYRAVLSSPDVEAVIIATPTHTHREIALAALDAGKHVYCEAPLAASVEDATAIAAAALKTPKLVFQAGLQGRSNALWQHVWKFVRSGVLGDPALVRTQWNRKDSWRRAAPTPEREAALNWRLRKATAAGLPGEIGVHQIDLMNLFLRGAPQAVTGTGAVVAWRDDREVPDTVQCVFEYPRNICGTFSATLASSFGGSSSVFQGSNSSLFVREKRAWLIKEADSPLLGWEVYARKETVQDETGIALVADATKLIEEGKEPGKEGSLEPALDAVHLAIDNFARSVRGRAKPAAGALDGLQATVVAIKAHEATLAGGRIELKPEWFTLKAEEE